MYGCHQIYIDELYGDNDMGFAYVLSVYQFKLEYWDLSTLSYESDPNINYNIVVF